MSYGYLAQNTAQINRCYQVNRHPRTGGDLLFIHKSHCLTSLSLWEGREERAGRVLSSKVPINAVKDSRNGIHSVSAIPYAEGVVFQSPGSAPPRKRQSDTLGDCRAEPLTPKALYRTLTFALFLWNTFGVRVFCGFSPRVRGRPRLRPGTRDPGLWSITASR